MKTAKLPTAVRLHITDHCNQRCIMCERWRWREANEERSELDLEAYEAILTDLAASGVKNITLTGGEPTLRPDMVDIVAAAMERGLKVAITSNGILLGDLVPELMKLPRISKKWFSANISLLGATAEVHEAITRTPGSFDRALASVRTLVEAGARVSIFFTVLPHNLDQVVSACELAQELGVGAIHFGVVAGYGEPSLAAGDLQRLRPVVETLTELRGQTTRARQAGRREPRIAFQRQLYQLMLNGTIPLADLERKTLARPLLTAPAHCTSVSRVAFVNPYGEVFPCHYAEFSNQDWDRFAHLRERFCAGRLPDQSFSDIWGGERYQDFLRRVQPIQPGDTDVRQVCDQCADLCSDIARKRGTSPPPVAVQPRAKTGLGPGDGSGGQLDIPRPEAIAPLSSLTLEQRIAQTLTCAIKASEALLAGGKNRMADFIAQYGLGLVGIFGRDPELVRACVVYLQRIALEGCGVPLLVGADAEQGLRHHFDFGTELPWQMAMGATGDPKVARRAGMIAGREARQLGLDLVFGPVADVLSNPRNKVVSTRSFGGPDAGEYAAPFVRAYVEGLQQAGVMATLKHYPGHGEAVEDSHLELPHDTSDLETMRAKHLPPFVAGFEAGAGAVMTAHVVFDALDTAAGPPATLSREVMQRLLREELGFKGLAIADSFNMYAIKKHLEISRNEAGVQGLLVGCDIVGPPRNLASQTELIRKAVLDGLLPEARLDEAAGRVLRAKAWILEHARPEPKVDIGGEDIEAWVQQTCDRAVSLLPGSTLSPLPEGPVQVVQVLDDAGRGARVPSTFRDRLLQARPGSTSHLLGERTGEDEVRDLAQKLRASGEPVVLAVLSPMMFFRGRSLLSETLEQHLTSVLAEREPAAAVVFGSPYILADIPAAVKLCGYGPAACLQRAAADVLLGRLLPAERAPFPWPEAQGEQAG